MFFYKLVLQPWMKNNVFLSTESEPSDQGSASNKDTVLCWCAPVALAAGEQLVQLAGGATVKMKLSPHPHSTLLELKDVDQVRSLYRLDYFLEYRARSKHI